ncbi:chemotaxis response regulator protein-glutamate methylesterase [Nocardioides sp.]|uniref:protein-glutamate methylesterase/protein-glutamine glutaminase n=1 Tax=Nocardioides sp. TaxID=35761 RepID=UPI0027338E85|nr:chemotaxis response regulator protein-glutamate methylesterase [Nocardioides sp.]MDP3890232.1 chemotaxis response regulator protein-glutamate methylesterase [Nocardioides sp.]
MIRVLVVDDSALVRRLVATSLSGDPEIEVVGQAVDGHDAVARVEELMPDAVTLDIEMPVLDGLGALRAIRERHPRLPVIMFSTLTEKGAIKTLEALSLGASDYVTKPSNTGSVAESMASVREQLVPKIKALTGVRRMAVAAAAASGRAGSRAPAAPPVTTPHQRSELLLIGCSTGGPDALSRVLADLPASLPVPALVVQHMPPVFTTMFAERLDRESPLTVREAGDRTPLAPGEVLVAPGDFHLRLQRGPGGLRTRLDQGPQVNYCRPAVDVLFDSAADAVGGRALVLVLTGMGHDGLVGTRRLRELGARVLVQDQATSVVWGMPGAIVEAGLADAVLPLDRVATEVARILR